MLKKILKQVAGTVAQGTVIVGGITVVAGATVIKNRAAQNTVWYGMPRVVENIQKWKNK